MDQQDLFGEPPLPVLPVAGASAVLSPCGAYRYRLARWWAPGPRVGFVMLNPSTADHQTDDPTLRQCLGFARAWDYAGLEVVNLFALRSPDPKALRRAADPVGPENDAHLSAFLDEVARGGVARVVCAWGNHGRLLGRGKAVHEMILARRIHPHCLRVSGQGQPEHPLYKSLKLQPQPYCMMFPEAP